MSNRTKATSIPKKVREEVYTRDKGCIKGYRVDIARSFEEAIEGLKEYLCNR